MKIAMTEEDSDQEFVADEYQHLVHSEEEDEQFQSSRTEAVQVCPIPSLKVTVFLCWGIIALAAIAALLAYLSGDSGYTLVDVTTDCGVVRGYHSSTAYTFKAIPYAVPPVGSQRWTPSAGLKTANACWNGTYDATQFRDMCAQVRPMSQAGRVLGSEDCLHLNVWTPSLSKDANLPVMVYIHGGFLHVLSSFEEGYHPTEMLAKQTNIVYVSFNYRLNAFGFLALELLRQNSPQNTSGNYGFLDQIEALRWVRNNIHSFGGNPEKVTIFGHSSGGTSVLALMMSPLAKGLFHRAIDMSGALISSKSLEETEKDNLIFLKKTECKTLQCLHLLPTEKVLQAIPWQEYPNWAENGLWNIPLKGESVGTIAVVDGYVIPEPPLEMLKNKNLQYNDVPLVVGTTQQEADFSPSYPNISTWTQSDLEWIVKANLDPYGTEISTEALQAYDISKMCTTTDRCFEKVYTTMVSDMRSTCPMNDLAGHAAEALSSPVYRYVVTYNPSQETKDLFLTDFKSRFAFHGLDIFGFFGALDFILGETTVDDRNFSRLFQKYFAHFAKNGLMPDEWKTYPNKTALLSSSFSTVDKYYPGRCAIWKKNSFDSYAWIN
ncbi:liver carboxylesterase 1-like [Protopterus annectens]|uniref:liver carboxylesterase 1-like n=1 Tax=Protopterus annectens TaxID=7888 RepID=UPI001CFB811B|nr:liver carboxylesterase 1-like [Protopterus annectens]